jgi:hypothetical protein
MEKVIKNKKPVAFIKSKYVGVELKNTSYAPFDYREYNTRKYTKKILIPTNNDMYR